MGVELLIGATAATVLGIIVGYVTILGARAFGIGVDSNQAQYKSHDHCVPRLGGIAVSAGFFSGGAVLSWLGSYQTDVFFVLSLSLMPALLIGLLEDFTQSVSTMIRLLVTMLSAALAYWLLDVSLLSLGIEALDYLLLLHPAVGFGFMLVAVAGVSHAFNIIDGCNGLSSFIAMIVLSSLAAVAFQVDDTFVMCAATVGAAAMFGFFVWNFPFGRLFMGDGGAYFTGMLIAVLSIMLVSRNPDVSPWFPMLLVMYPVWETVYSAYRRVVIQKISPGTADRLHLHNLVYFRVVPRVDVTTDLVRRQVLRSSTTSAHIWLLAIACAIPALLFWDESQSLMLCCGLFALSYVGLYRSLVRFRSVSLPLLRSKKASIEAPSEA